MSAEIQQTAEAVQHAAQATEATGGLGTLGINLKIFIAQLVNFTIVLLVLWKWAYTPIVNLLEERQEKIAKGIKQAEDVEKRVHDLEKERDEVITSAKVEASKVLEEARLASESQKKKLLEKAKTEVKTVIDQGKTQLNAEKEQMIRDARDQIATIAVEAARKILADGVDKKKAEKMAKSVIEQMVK